MNDSPVKRALVEIRRLRRELEQARRGSREPVAIIGMGLRLPGVGPDPDALHAALAQGVDGIREVPADRWDVEGLYAPARTRGRTYVRKGGFLDDVRGFDPEFFGITPVEAEAMDPQHRMLLEVVWEALEHAGVAASELKGSRTGVYLGMSNSDYGRIAFSRPDVIDEYASLGTAFSVAAGRISYLLDLTGPAVTVDTACSSSLVAAHLACASLRRREADLAIVGAVNLILSPEVTINFCQAGMLSADGLCKAFDAAADGYVRSEGCGALVLKRLSHATAEGDRILAVIRGTAINQDGRSSGITAPNGPAQEAVMREALADAGLEPSDIGYVEAHGTGTSLGDPIEMQAVGAVHRERSRTNPLWVGSVKSNFGHLEAAAGIAGVLKVVGALRNAEIPPSLHFQDPSPHIPWRDLPLAIPTGPVAFPSTGGARRAGVSSFGFSGTNAHLILEEAPALAEAPAPDGSSRLLTLSTPRTDDLALLASRLAAHLRKSGSVLADVALTANTGRASFRHRLALVACSPSEAADALDEWVARGEARGVVTGHAGTTGFPTTALVFRGDTDVGRSASLARWLWRLSPVGRAALESADETLQSRARVSILKAWGCDGTGPGRELPADVLGAAGLALQHAVARTWMRWGLRPDQLVFTGLGALAAAAATDRTSLEDALVMALVVARKGADDPEVATLLGEAVRSRPDPGGEIAWVSTGGGHAAGAGSAGPDLWLQAVRGGADLAAATRTALAQGAEWLVSTCASPLPDAVAAQLASGAGSWFAAVAGDGDESGLLEPLGRLYALGFTPDWNRVHEGRAGRKTSLPTYPFRRRDLWLAAAEPAAGPPDRRLRPSGSADPWRAAVEAGLERASWAPLDLNVGSYAQKWKRLTELTEVIGANLVMSLGGVSPDEPRTADQVLAATGIVPMYRPIVVRWLASMERGGLVERDGDALRLAKGARPREVGALWEQVEALMADNLPLLRYVRHCAALAEGVMVGRTSPLETLFPGGSFELATDLYERSTGQRYVNGIAAAALSGWVDALQRERPVRILEVGAGTGGTTSSLLAALPEGRTQYVFSDVSDVFLAAAAERFRETAFLETRRYDLEVAPSEQGVVEGSFDVVVGANVLHAVRHLPRGLERVKSMISPGGILLLVESTGHLGWHDLTTGLIEGWQHFEDELRRDTPLLTVEAWKRILEDAGFSGVASFPPEGSPGNVLRQNVILARVPGEVSRAARPEVATGAPTSRSTTERAPGKNGQRLAALLAEAIGPEREEVTVDAVRSCVVDVLRWDPARPPSTDARLMELGVDSLMAVRVRNRLQETLGVEALPSTLIFDYPTIRHIAALLLEMDSGAANARQVVEPPAPAVGELDRREGELAAMSDEDAVAELLRRLDGEAAR